MIPSALDGIDWQQLSPIALLLGCGLSLFLLDWLTQPSTRSWSLDFSGDDVSSNGSDRLPLSITRQLLEPSDSSELRYIAVGAAILALPIVIHGSHGIMWVVFILLLIGVVAFVLLWDQYRSHLARKHDGFRARTTPSTDGSGSMTVEKRQQRKTRGGNSRSSDDNSSDSDSDSDSIRNLWKNAFRKGSFLTGPHSWYNIGLCFFALLCMLGLAKLGGMLTSSDQGAITGFGLGAIAVALAVFYIAQSFLPYGYGMPFNSPGFVGNAPYAPQPGFVPGNPPNANPGR